MYYFVDVILPLPLNQEFTYSISKSEASFLKPGMRVAVPFGKSKLYTGIVVSVHNTPPKVYEAKEIEYILDESPIVTSKQLRLWSWISSYYLCAKGEVLRAALPNAYLLESETIIIKNEKAEIDETSLTDQEFLLYEALQFQSVLKIQEIKDILNKKNILGIVKSMLDKNVISVQETLKDKYKPKLVRYLKIHSDYDNDDSLKLVLDSITRAPRQREVILQILMLRSSSNPLVKIEDIKTEKNSASAIKTLLNKGVLEERSIRTDRLSFQEDGIENLKPLNQYQLKALKEIQKGFLENKVCLLHGVTASGKTELYASLIHDMLQEGKQILYLVPEIALTTQLIMRLQKYFGPKLTVYHSRYTSNERLEVWNNVQAHASKAQVIVGARSSIFLPFSDLGLIIVDEEHENTYKQFNPSPRYHARDTAIVLANISGAKIILGSATPSIESYYNATRANKYKLISLSRRHGDVLMPEINLIDIKQKYRKKEMTGHFSDILLENIRSTLNQNGQVILFQNRRGYSPVIECGTCGHSPQCTNCDVSLTYHQYKNQLRCHYCGYHISMPKQCPACNSATLTTKGFGTEQIEKELIALFPEHTIARMDQDTTKGKKGHERIIENFEKGHTDILVGTQMLAKGLDFRNVKLVGVMNADQLLNFPDFRAHERSFQLLLQVAGRSGRTKERGKVLVQTFNAYHQILQQVSIYEYQTMFKDQILQRNQYKYPPFCRMIRVSGKHKDYNKVNESMEWLGVSFRNVFKENVLGPEFSHIARIRNQYHKHIMIKIPSQQSLEKTKQILRKIHKSFLSIKNFSGVRIIFDVDPY